MAKGRSSQFRLLLPADKIALAYGVDQKRARQMQAGLVRHMEFLKDLVLWQAELIEGQTETSKLIDKQTRQAQDAGQTRQNTLRFLAGDPAQVEKVIDMIFTPFWRNEFIKLRSDIKISLFAELTIAIESLDDSEKESG